MFNLINFALFQLLWFSCVLGTAYGVPWLGLISLSAFVIVHTLISPNRYADILLGAICLSCGLILDTAWSYFGWLTFVSYEWAPMAPLWLLSLWFGFGLTLNHSMAWMQGRYALALVAGAVFGPLSYFAGVRLGAMQWLEADKALAALLISWGLFMPFIMHVATRINRAFPATLSAIGEAGSKHYNHSVNK